MIQKFYGVVEKFIKNLDCLPNSFLLALSGGADSLFLFYALVNCIKKLPFKLHVAHVNHNWRLESSLEAQILRDLVESHAIPFHLHTLFPERMKGNLEDLCRQERLRFFTELCYKHALKGVFMGHHQDDQNETILKRILEGAHWSKWGGLKKEYKLGQLQIFRPLLHISKKDIKKTLKDNGIVFFQDNTNQDIRFLRPRMREVIFPHLAQHFGKEITKNIAYLGKEVAELNELFLNKLIPLVDAIEEGPFGFYVDVLPFKLALVEIRYLLRHILEKAGMRISRESIEEAAIAISERKTRKTFCSKTTVLNVDQGKIFVLIPKQIKWHVEMTGALFDPCKENSSWKEHWKGTLKCWVPKNEYTISQNFSANTALKNWWNKYRVPYCLRSIFPILACKGNFYYEFLTGRSFYNYTPDIDEEGIAITLFASP